jgi:hypothetical protein
MGEEELYEKALKRVEAKIGFYKHLAVYVGVNLLLVIINLLSSRHSIWFIWPLFGWGIGLFIHGLTIFAFSGPSGMKERMIQKEMVKERGGRN